MLDLPACRQTHSFELTKFTADQKFAHFDKAIIIPSLFSMSQSYFEETIVFLLIIGILFLKKKKTLMIINFDF